MRQNIDKCSVVQAIRIEFPRGTGKDNTDPVRMVVQHWTMDGVLIGEDDPLFEPAVNDSKKPDFPGLPCPNVYGSRICRLPGGHKGMHQDGITIWE
jgi:hypothetical protein